MRANSPKIVLINQANGRVTDSTLMKIASAVQRQVQFDFARAWGIAARVELMRRGDRRPPDPAAWWLVVLEHSDQPEALGYHDLTPQGKPLAKVFAKDIEDAGDELSLVISHEALEMLADPACNGFEHHVGSKRLYAREVCDPVEGRDYAYAIQGVLVSDFVTPAYFHDGASGPYDHRRAIKSPFQIAPGGYLPALDPETGSWEDVEQLAHGARHGGRLDRRLRAHVDALRPSEAETNAPLAPAPKQGPVAPARRPENAPRALPAKRFRPVPPVPIRQPDRGGNSLVPAIGVTGVKIPPRQPLRGSRLVAARLAAEHAAAAAVADPPKVPARQPLRGDRVNQAPKQHGKVPPVPARQPLRRPVEHPTTETTVDAEHPVAQVTPPSAPPTETLGDSAGASGAVDASPANGAAPASGATPETK